MIKKPGKLTLLSNTALGFIAFLGILVFVALIGQRHPMRLDLTESKRYSISDQSQKIVESLKDDINIKGFYQQGANPRFTGDLSILLKENQLSVHRSRSGTQSGKTLSDSHVWDFGTGRFRQNSDHLHRR